MVGCQTGHFEVASGCDHLSGQLDGHHFTGRNIDF